LSVTSACSPNPLNAGDTTTCTATVSDTDTGIRTAPTGVVTWSTSGGGTYGTSSCTLSGSGTSTTCQVPYTPIEGGAQTLTASYGGDATHLGNSGTSTLTVHRTSGTSVV